MSTSRYSKKDCRSEPEKFKQMKLALDALKRPMKVKVRCYPGEQRTFLDAYFAELVNIGFLKTCS